MEQPLQPACNAPERHVLLRPLIHPLERITALRARHHWLRGQAMPAAGNGEHQPPMILPEDMGLQHYGLHLNGDFVGYGRLERPASGAQAGISVSMQPTFGHHRIDLLCTDPVADTRSWLVPVLLECLLAVVWSDAPDAPILVDAPAGSMAHGALGGMLANPSAAWTPGCQGVAESALGLLVHRERMRAEVRDRLAGHGAKWRRARVISTLVRPAPSWPNAAR